MVYISSLASKMTIYSAKKVLISLLFVEKVTIPAEYFDFIHIFFKKLVVILLKGIEVNEYTIDLKQ